MNQIDIRRLTEDDAPLYREIRLDSLQKDPTAFGSTFEREITMPMEFFRERVAASTVLGAFQGDTIIGVIGFMVQTGKLGHKGMLWAMYVRPEHRNKGIGRRLVQALIDVADQRVEVIQLAVETENSAARNLYAAMGFVEYGLELKAMKDEARYYDCALMALDLMHRP
jgi:ribosomal protein S18 acetylase RimI-like enzyme